ncbi:glycosyltransferase family 4 protein [Neptunomonas phycophila]|uniref:Glycosyltransferase family 4 protein n=1 Tax=Neptunomonas phycophila TaxID=1572645 RepID=A0AAW7XKT9_9GAMM|nr:glycosyltransferase family 4 protein [Neptunomonas phycophila]MDO6454351.1 glycosyltransferase family 4 protein [Neptunomonas phycophila]
MKILVVANLYPNEAKPYWGTFVRECYLGYQENSIETDLCVIKGSGGGAYLTFYLCTFLKALAGKYDVVHVHYVSHSVLPVLLAKFFRNFHLIVNFHGSDAFSEIHELPIKVKVKEFINKWAIKKARALVVPSEYFRKEISDYYQVKKKIFVSPSGGVRNDLFKPAEKFESSCLYVGRMIQEKGAITAFNAVIKNRKGINKACFIGDGEQKEKIIEQSRGYNIELIGLVSHKDLANTMSKYEFLLFPSVRKGESLGLLLVEAIFCGMIPLAIDNGAVKEVIHSDLHDMLIAPTPSNYSTHLSKLLSMSAEERNSIKSKLINHVLQRYDHEVVSSNLSAMVREMVGDHE